MPSNASSTAVTTPLIFGEVLFDCFPDASILGGAPFNVAWNLKGLGLDPLVVTAVGNDDLGRSVLQRMSDWDLDQSGVRVCEELPTGRVDIEVEQGEPTYTFLNNVAFDHISADIDRLADRHPALLYHGSLALRGIESLQTLRTLRSRLDCPVFVDINVRQPHFRAELIPEILQCAEHVKLNHEELSLLADSANLETNSNDLWQQRFELGTRFKRRHSIQHLWITAAAEGAAWIGPSDQFLHLPAPAVENMVDTVGAGDAFSSVLIHGILRQRPIDEILANAAAYAAKVCTLRGATTDDASFYADFAQRLL